jgi:hypothetical protein
MTVLVKHKFTSTVPDGQDPTLVQPSAWNDGHALTGGALRVMGFASDGTATDLALGASLTSDGSTLSVSSTVTATAIALSIALG